MKSVSRPGSDAWIISPTWDLVCLVATPAAIFPALWLLGRHVVSPEQVYLAAFAFASFGHHLPGFLRAYGDRRLFAQYRWRFLLAPPLICAVVLLFAWQDLHGLILIMFVWATWHVLMQSYGLLRIYDAKRGNLSRTSARLDLLACLAIFAAGIVFSEARLVGLADDLWQTGLPVFTPGQLQAAKWLVGAGTAGLICVYLAHALHAWHRGVAVSWQKLALVLSTGGLYWASGSVSTNVLVGVAMFDIFHAVQYFAIVWVYNRQVVGKSTERMPAVGLLFRGRAWSLGLYAAAIALYGAGFFALQSLENLAAEQAATILFTTSACLHFYYDGFIWKISQRRTRRDLQLADASPQNSPGDQSGFAPARTARPITLWHGWKWAALALVAAALVVLERRQGEVQQADEYRQLVRTAAIAPNLPDVQSRLCHAALDRGETQRALAVAERAVALRPRSSVAHEDLAAALQQAGRLAQAESALRVAVRRAPRRWRSRLALAQVLRQSEDWNQAERSYRNAAQLAPENAGIQRQWAEMRIAAQRFEQALPVLKRALQLDHQSAETHYLLGVARMQTQQFPEADEAFQHALRLAPRHTQARFQLGNLNYLTGDFETATQRFRQCLQFDPQFCDAHNNLGAALAEQQRWREAADCYRRALKLRPGDANANYNLGLVLLQTGDRAAARSRLRRAAALGRPPGPALAAELNLPLP
jgi:tetratricopeptide (TPR) repeat protein